MEDAENGLTHLSRKLFAEHYQKLKELDQAIKSHDQRIARLCQQNQRSKRFLDVPGVGIITASIIATDIGDGKAYASGRDYAASLGVVPKQHSSGDKQVYLGVSKRGNRYIRKADTRCTLGTESLLQQNGQTEFVATGVNRTARF